MVNPSPYMIYSQARGSTLVASSPEILCKVESDGTVTNRSVPEFQVPEIAYSLGSTGSVYESFRAVYLMCKYKSGEPR